jgi:hypothetical protein
MSAHIRRPIFQLLVFSLVAAPLSAQADSTARPVVPAVVTQPAGATRSPGADTTVAARERRATVSDADPILATLAGALIGGVAGAMFDDACFGGGDGMALRGAIGGAALTIPIHFLTRRDANAPEPDRSKAWYNRMPRPLLGVVVSATVGLALGAPIGAIEGARHPDACGGSASAGAIRGAGQVAAGAMALGTFGMAVEWATGR